MTTFMWIFKLEMALLVRQGHYLIQPLMLFVLVAILFPLSLPKNEVSALHVMAPGIIWVTALLSVMMGLERLFRDDYLDGTLEQFVLSEHSVTGIVLAKVTAYWCSNGFLISALSPVIGYSLGMDGDTLWLLFLSLALGTFILSLIGAVGAALTLASRQGHLLIALLVLPLYIPTVIFGASAISAQSVVNHAASGLYYLAAMFVLALTLCPIAISLIIESTLD